MTPDIEPADSGDQRYYKRLFNFAWLWRLSHRPRFGIIARFLAELSPQEADSVLDLGCAALPEPLENIFEHLYPHVHRVTAVGVEDASFLEKRHPGLKFVRVPAGAALPFSDDAFDIGFSGATIEHAGSRDRQRLFLAELIRVTRRCFLTTPNRWFPLEMHTRLPLVHWLPPAACRAIMRALGFDFYAREENLNLLSASGLRALLPPGEFRVRLLKHWSFGFPSNLILIVEKTGSDRVDNKGEMR